MFRNTLESERRSLAWPVPSSFLHQMLLAHWYLRRGGDRFTCPELHPSHCIFYFLPSDSWLSSTSLRHNLGHENLVFSLSTGGNTHSWLGLENTEHFTGQNTPAEHTHTHMAEQFFCLRGPQTVNSDPWHREKQSWIYTHGARSSWTLQVKCAMWTSPTCWPCSAGYRSQFPKQETECNTTHPCYHCTGYWSQATEMFPKV